MIRIQQGVTTFCSCDCAFCPRHVIHVRRTLGHIEPEMVEISLKRYEEMDEPYIVSISGFGEPLLWPGIFDYIDRLKELGAEVEMNTNATHLTPEAGRRLIGVLDELQVGLNTPGPETYRQFKGNMNTYELVEKNLIDFYKMKGSRKPVTDIRLLSFKQTRDAIPEAMKKWGRIVPKGDAIRVTELENWMGLIDADVFGAVYPEIPPHVRVVCADLSGRYLTITKEGNAFACCFAVALPEDHPFKLGNIRDHGIKELLEGDKRKELYTIQRDVEYVNECVTCSKIRVRGLMQRYLTPDWYYEQEEGKIELDK